MRKFAVAHKIKKLGFAQYVENNMKQMKNPQDNFVMNVVHIMKTQKEEPRLLLQ